MADTKSSLVMVPIFILNLCTHFINGQYGPDNPSSQVLAQYAENTTVIGNYTRANGAPIYDLSHSMTAGLHGPLLVQDRNFLENLQHWHRERIPERVVHAKGAGAFGYFETTNDLSEYTQASVLTNVGKKTRVLARFSRGGGNLGEADTVRDLRGLAIKFYTDQGNWDLVCLNTPYFWIRDTMKAPSLIHALKRNPVTNLYDPVAFWDFLSLSPESLPTVMNFFSDQGIPMNYRTMNVFSGNTFVLTKPDGKVTYVKFNILTNQGVHNMPPDQATITAGTDPDLHTRDLYNSIAKKEFPSWNVTADLLTPEQAAKMSWDPFDPTKLWPREFTTTVQMGILVLDRNPTNYFAQVEQAAFNPSRLIPGIEPSQDTVLQGRLFSYADTALHRLGINHEQLPINRPIVVVENNERDGPARYDDNQGGAPNYFPNSFKGPEGNLQYKRAAFLVSGLAQSYNTSNEDNFMEPSLIWMKLTESERNNLTTNIAQSLSKTPVFIQERALNNFYQVSREMGSKVALLLSMSKYDPPMTSS